MGSSVNVTYDATLLGTVQPGETLPNTAAIRYTSLPGANGTAANPTGSSNTGLAGSNTGERDGSGTHNDYADTDSASVTVAAATLAKSLMLTSITSPNNSNDEVVIGELVQYQLVVTLPEGVTNAATIVDTLDSGLAFVSIDSIVTSAGIASDNLAIDMNNAGTIPVSTVGQSLSFDFGNLTNSNDNAAVETITIRYTALVENVAGNQGEGTPGTLLDNSAEFTWSENGNPRTTGSDSADAVEVIEPDLGVAKAVAPTSVDAADSVVYTIDVTHTLASDTDAFDITFSDTIPAGLTVTGFSVAHSASGDISGLFELAGNTIQTVVGSSFDMLLGESVVVTVNADTNPAIVVGGSVTNTAAVAWTSINDADANERNGAGGVNDYTASGSVDLALSPPSLAKNLVGTSINTTNNASNQAVIGETIQYALTLFVPEGTLVSASIRDTLDAGLEFVSVDSLVALSGGAATTDVTTDVGLGDFSDTASFAPSISGNTLTFQLGTIANLASGDGVSEALTLTYTARVRNTAGNQTETNTRLNNSALVAWEYGGLPNLSSTDAAAEVEVIEPELNVAKAVAPTSVDAVDSVVYTIDVTHNLASDTDAFDITFSDTIPAGLTVTGFSVVHSASGDISGLFELVGNTIQTVAGSSFDLLLGESAAVTVNADTNPAIVVGGSVTNTAAVAWSSINGADANERHGAGGVNDYTASGSVDLALSPPSLAKNLVGTSIDTTNNASNQAVIGETIQYALTLFVPEGTLVSASIQDTLDAGLEFVSVNSLVTLSGGAATTDVTTDVGMGDFSDPASFTPSISGNALTFQLGTIDNAAAGDGVTESLTLTYTVRVRNTAGNQTETNTLLNNSAVATWEYGGLPNLTMAAAAPEVEVLEPLLQIAKTIDDDTPRLGQTVHYVVELRHTLASDADAQDVHFADMLPAAMTLDAGSLMITGATPDVDNSVGNTVDLIFNAVPLGTIITVEYSATVSTDPSDIGVSLNNTAVADWTSLPGNDANERDNRDGEGGAVNDYEASSARNCFSCPTCPERRQGARQYNGQCDRPRQL